MKTFLLASIFLVGCSSTSNETKINERLNAETKVSDPSSLGMKAYEIIDLSPSMTVEQKEYLKTFMSQVYAENTKLTKDSFRLRSILIQLLTSEKRDAAEVKATKNKLISVEKKKLENTFQFLDKLEEYMGKDLEKIKSMNEISDLMFAPQP